VGAGELTLFLDGQARSSVPLDVPGLAGDLLLGAGPEGAGPFTGEVDELQVSRVRRDPAWLLAAARLQGGDGFLVAGEDEQRQGGQGGESYFVSILRNVTLDGWVVIGIIAVIGVVSWMVMGAKALVFARTERDNARFLEQFRALDPSNPAALDRAGGAEDRDLDESPFLTALTGRHEHFQSSSLYRLYHVGAQALQSRLGTSAGARAAALGPQALGAIRAAVEGAMVGETQRLSSQMVLLTIAISGGPFLGLLGTVVGVMITFAAIAATGDVNINAIAPGIAAALVATVAGLAVAIPALFAYNYLSTRLRDLVAQMEVFVGEFVSLAAEQHGQ
jgi:biopolymer transport protein ExbB